MSKRQLFKLGRYTCPTPKGDTVTWTTAIWIDYIDLNGKWLW